MLLVQGAPDDDQLAPYATAFTDWLACTGGGLRRVSFPAPDETGLFNGSYRLAVAGHYLDFDDTHLPSMCHLSAATAPAALIAGASVGATVREVVRAYALGYETMGRLGRATNPRMYHLGWHATSACGVVGASVAAAWFLAPDSISNAALLSTTGASGTLSSFGTDAKSVQVGLSALSGIGAVLAAAGGAKAPTDVFEGGAGFSHAYVGGDEIVFDADNDTIRHNWIKPYPCCLQTHTTVEAALKLRRRGWKAEKDGFLRLRISPLGRRAANRSIPATPLEAKFSPQYVGALTLLKGKEPTVEDFDAIDDKVIDLARNIELVVDESLSEPHIVLEPEPGAASSALEVTVSPGSPEDPLSDGELETKWAGLTGIPMKNVISRADAPAAELLDLLAQAAEKQPSHETRN